MATKYEMSKTYQYRKVMKPLLERKRRARINKCLDDLKDLMAGFLQQQSGDTSIKLEKADILESTVQYLTKVKEGKHLQRTNGAQPSFRSGYIHAANEVSRCLASLPNVDISLGTKLMTHLGLRLNQLESAREVNTAVNIPLAVNCSTIANNSHSVPALYSPISSGYASDSDCSRSSPGLLHKGLLQTATPVWRPW